MYKLYFKIKPAWLGIYKQDTLGVVRLPDEDEESDGWGVIIT